MLCLCQTVLNPVGSAETFSADFCLSKRGKRETLFGSSTSLLAASSMLGLLWQQVSCSGIRNIIVEQSLLALTLVKEVYVFDPLCIVYATIAPAWTGLWSRKSPQTSSQARSMRS